MDYIVKTDDFEFMIENQKTDMCKSIAAQLKEKRIQKGMTQQDIEDITGIKRANVARFEACNATPTIDIMLKYAKAVGCDLSIQLKEIKK